MPKSKRNKLVSLTKVKKKGRDGKEQLVDKIQDCCDDFGHSYIVSYENIRSTPFKDLQLGMNKTSKFFLGKNKVMMKALGRKPEDEIADNTARLSRFLTGQVCLAFSNLDPKKFDEAMQAYEVEDYAQAGAIATFDVFLEKGTESLAAFSHAMEPQLRTLGLPTKLNFQKIELLQDVYVCKKGSKLSVEQCKLLKLMGHKMARFSLKILTHRTKEGKVKDTDHGLEFLARHHESEA